MVFEVCVLTLNKDGSIKVIFYLLILMFYVQNSYSYITNSDCLLVNKLRKFVFAIQCIMKENDMMTFHTCGTGFLSNNKIGEVYGVTCRHVIEPFKNKPIFAAIETDSGLIRFPLKVIYVDDKLDYAILNINAQGKVRTSLFSNNIWTDTDIVFPGKSVLTVGYPLGLGVDLKKNSPIVRSGMIAQEIITNHFIIDGIVNPGNSGSPVFSLSDEKLVGMIIAYCTDNVVIKSTEKNYISIPYNSGLSVAIDVKVIKRQIELLP